MAKRIGIVAVAQTKYSPARYDADWGEVCGDAVNPILEETGLKWVDDGTGIDASIIVTDDFWDNRTISDLSYESVLGYYDRDHNKVEGDGIFGAMLATCRILALYDDVIMLAASTKESCLSSRNLITNCVFDTAFDRPLGVDFVVSAALQARRYMSKYGITREQCAKVVVKNRKNAKNNPFAQAAADLSVKDVLNAEMLAAPISVLDYYPVSDGACAMLLATEEKAKKLTSKPIWIKGFGSSRDTYRLGDRDLAECDSLTNAAKLAYKMAGITDPTREIDLFEIAEEASYQELLWSEGLGLCGRGGGGKLIDSGKTQMAGKLPINASGGVLSGIPHNVIGLSRIAECVLQLRGEAGARQIDGAKVALAHGFTGPAGQHHGVVILEK